MKSFEEIYEEPDEYLTSRVWFHLLRAHRFLYPKIEKELRKHGFDSPLWHEILLEVERAGDRGIRSSELQKKLHMAQFNLSRHLSRMEKKGFITRITCPEDKRAHYLHLTEAGKQANDAIWPIYYEIIQTELGGKFNHDEAFQLFKSLTKLYE